MKKVSGIILASGESRRFGENKLFYKINGKMLIEYTIENARNSLLYEKIIVFNPAVNYSVLNLNGFKIAINYDYKNGMSTSIGAGLRKVENNIDGVMILLGDSPLIDQNIINRMINIYSQNDAGIVSAYNSGIPVNPAIFSSKYFNDLLNLKGDVGGRFILRNHPEDIIRVEIDNNALLDVDTKEDLKKIFKN
ncbi:nucleotidyltransferase family protein [Acidiplasma sp.]|uniref:nucleotidyltransferase family protein n=1 Tax=Acidiplasma sp. TaxID=1872114 RepID=UPI002584121C|nr:nucleotidyltransferase family protein [Acidiplasma sp.]